MTRIFFLAARGIVAERELAVKPPLLPLYFLVACLGNMSCSSPQVRSSTRPSFKDYFGFFETRSSDVKLEDLTVLGENGSLILPQATPLPFYPIGPLRAGIAGQVDLLLSVDAKGDVTGAKVVRSNGREFEEAALHSVEEWKFFRRDSKTNPSTLDVQVSCRIRFELSSD